MPPGLVAILDACVLINMLASGRAHHIMSQTPYQFGICSVVRDESIYLRSADSSTPPEEVTLDLLLESGLLAVYELSGQEEEGMYVDYAAELDDGEAMSLALVCARGLVMASDDRKARRLFAEEISDPSRLLSTAQILKEWSAAMNLPPAELKIVLREVSIRGRFIPSPADPHFAWWSAAVR